jgi:MurNAc alpha-1-phosphate uridylyltransferase
MPQKTPQSAMVLAAGFGQRMRPLTDNMPKPLVKVAGKALLDHVLDRLADAGVARAVVNVHYLAEQIERHVAARNVPRVTISWSRRCRSWAMRRSSTSIPTRSGSTA